MYVSVSVNASVECYLIFLEAVNSDNPYFTIACSATVSQGFIGRCLEI